jgi:hypothetical protein
MLTDSVTGVTVRPPWSRILKQATHIVELGWFHLWSWVGVDLGASALLTIVSLFQHSYLPVEPRAALSPSHSTSNFVVMIVCEGVSSYTRDARTKVAFRDRF